jgi:effector-binding domain-containing protein
MKIEFTVFDECNFFYVINRGSYQKLGKSVGEVEALLSELSGKFTYGAVLMSDPSCTSEDMLYSEVGLFAKQDIKIDFENIKSRHFDQFNVCKTHYTGDINGVSKIYENMQKEIINRNYILAGYPIELYNKHPVLAEKDGICDLFIMLPIAQQYLNDPYYGR